MKSLPILSFIFTFIIIGEPLKCHKGSENINPVNCNGSCQNYTMRDMRYGNRSVQFSCWPEKMIGKCSLKKFDNITMTEKCYCNNDFCNGQGYKIFDISCTKLVLLCIIIISFHINL